MTHGVSAAQGTDIADQGGRDAPPFEGDAAPAQTRLLSRAEADDNAQQGDDRLTNDETESADQDRQEEAELPDKRGGDGRLPA